MVGRAEELRFIEQALGESDAGGVVLAGEAGCGKTRLAREALVGARERGFITEWFVATQATSDVPLAAFADLLPSADDRTDDTLTLLVRAHRALEKRAGGRRLVLGIDDVHVLDPTSAAFVRQLAGAHHVICTLRTGEPAPAEIVALWKDGPIERLEVQPLSWLEMQSLLETVLEGPLEGRTLHRLWTQTQGNVLYLRELVLGGTQTGMLRRSDGMWTWQGDLVVPRLTDLIEARLGSPSAAEKDVLELLAIGEPIAAGQLEMLADAEALESLERSGFLISEERSARSMFRLAHPLYGEVLRSRVPAMRARKLKRRLTAAVAEQGVLGLLDRIRVTLWSLDLGELVDPQALIDLANVADDRNLSERLARAAIDAGGGFEALTALGNALFIQGRSEEVEQVLGEAAPSAESDTLSYAQFAGLRATNLYFGLGRTAEALEVIDKPSRHGLDPEWIALLAGEELSRVVD